MRDWIQIVANKEIVDAERENSILEYCYLLPSSLKLLRQIRVLIYLFREEGGKLSN